MVALEEQKSIIKNSNDAIFKKIENLVKLCASPLKLYLSGLKEEKRELLKIIKLNFTIDRKRVVFSMVSPFYELANRDIVPFGAPSRDTVQTLTPKIIYTDKNTSPIIPKPLNRQQLKQFFNFLLKTTTSLQLPTSNEYQYELSKDNTCS